VETNLAWNLTEKERLTLYNDSAEELGRLSGFQCFFSLRAWVSPESSVQPLLFLSTVEPRLSGHVGTAVKSPDNRESG